MINRGAQALVNEAATRAEHVRASLLKDMSSAAERLERQNEKARKRQIRQGLAHQRQLRMRVSTALRGLNALCAIGASTEFQSLIKAQGGPITLWGGSSGPRSPGGDMADVCWEYVGALTLTTSGVKIEYYSKTNDKIDWYADPLFVTIPYSVEDNFLRSRPLLRIGTASALDLDKLHNTEIYTTEAIFEVFVECAEPKLFEKYFRRAVR